MNSDITHQIQRMDMPANLISFDWWLATLSEYLIHPFIMILLCLISVFVVLGNLLVVSAIWHEHQLHSVTNYLIASLAAADCLVGAVVMPFSIISEIIIGSWTFGETWCDLWHSFDVLASTASIMNLCAISLDRYLAITDPISYPSRMTSKRVALLIVSLWTCSSLISFPAILWWRAVGQGPLEPMLSSLELEQLRQTQISQIDDTLKNKSSIRQGDTIVEMKPEFKCVFTDDPYYLLFSSFISFYGPLCVMLYAYYRIYKAAVQQTRFLKHGSKQVMIGRSKKKKRSKNLSERSSHGPGNTAKPNGAACDEETNVEGCNMQHLVLRAHRGGGGQSGSSMRRSSNGDISKASIKSPKNLVVMKNGPTTSRFFNDIGMEEKKFSFDRQDKPTCGTERANQSSLRQQRLKIKSQRFDSDPIDRQLSVCANNVDKTDMQLDSKLNLKPVSGVPFTDIQVLETNCCGRLAEDTSHTPRQLHSKPTFAFINCQSSSVDVSTIDAKGNKSAQSDIAESDLSSDSSLSCSDSYGSIVSVMVKPQEKTARANDEIIKYAPVTDISSDKAKSELIDRRVRHNSIPSLRAVDELEMRRKSLKVVSNVDKSQNLPCKTQHRGSCADQTLSMPKSIRSLSIGGLKTPRTLRIRSWVRLPRAKPSEDARSDGEIKPPPSLIPLMMMNSETSTDSSTASASNKKLVADIDFDENGTKMLKNGACTKAQIKHEYESNTTRCVNITRVRTDIEISKLSSTSDANPINNAVGAIWPTDDSFEQEGKSLEKGQMLYYDSNKLMQSIVDLSAIHYIDCSNPNRPTKSQECEPSGDNTTGKQYPNLDDQMPDSRLICNNMPNPNKTVGKKLSKLAKERKAAKTLGIVVGVFILCWLPFFVMNIVVALCGTNCIYKLQVIVPIITWLGWLNSAMNPVIYACWSRDFRRAFRRVLCTWVEFICPYGGLNLVKRLKLKKSCNYSANGTYPQRDISIKRGTNSSTKNRRHADS